MAVDKSRLEHIRKVAIEWFGAIADRIGPAMEDRNRTVVSSPAVMAALGAMGHQLVEIEDGSARRSKQTELVERLTLIKWDKGQAWEGIAGKFTPAGKFSLGGSKENAYAVYAALTDITTEGYNRIRNKVDQAA